ncbi:MAG TPA: hypothetical protein VMS88_08090 [Terriglobales bacterium]|nr:hypothetical protein [Terriglobales bacterium]
MRFRCRSWYALTAMTLLLGQGCTTLREIPSSEYTERVPRQPVRVVTREGLSYQLDEARVDGDTLAGVRRRDVEGPVDEFDTLRLPLDQVASISARRVDWYRTGLIGLLSMGAVLGIGLSRSSSGGGDGGTDNTPRPPPPTSSRPGR